MSRTRSMDAIVKRIASDVKFFHWELEFPDVFTPESSGFDAALGNPPWEVMKPISQEFFTEFDPLYRTYAKQAAISRQGELFAAYDGVQSQWLDYNATFKAWSNWVKNCSNPFDLALDRGNNQKQLSSSWDKVRRTRPSYFAATKPFSLQGSADLNLYKLFSELFWSLLCDDGRIGE